MPQDFPFFLLLPEVKTCSMCCSVWTRKSSSRVASLEFTRSHAASRPDISSCFKISASRAGRSGCFSGPACKSMRSSLTKATPLPEPLCRPLASNQALVFQALACARVEVLWLDSAWDASGTTKWPEVRPGSGLMLRSCRSTAEHSWAQQRKRNQEIIDKSLWDTETRWYTLIYIVFILWRESCCRLLLLSHTKWCAPTWTCLVAVNDFSAAWVLLHWSVHGNMQTWQSYNFPCAKFRVACSSSRIQMACKAAGRVHRFDKTERCSGFNGNQWDSMLSLSISISLTAWDWPWRCQEYQTQRSQSLFPAPSCSQLSFTWLLDILAGLIHIFFGETIKKMFPWGS